MCEHHECLNCNSIIEFAQNIFCQRCWSAVSDDELEMLRRGGIE